jgi:hypothetical protein
MHQRKTASGQGETGPDTDFKVPSFGWGNDLFPLLIEPLLTFTYHIRAFKKNRYMAWISDTWTRNNFFHWLDS